MRWLIIALIMLSASRLAPANLRHGTVIWNVGQGQWITVAEGVRCLHFDMGGEFFPYAWLKHLCGDRENYILLSHWDWDHIGALADRKILKALPSLCLLSPPLGTSSARKMKLINRFTKCSDKSLKIFSWRPNHSRNSNESSQIHAYKGLLIPGDSTKKQESLWSQEPWVPSMRILIAGHHGSKTSTSEELLRRLPRLKMAIISARWRRYSHPHPETAAALKRTHVPMLRTEDWGHIWLD